MSGYGDPCTPGVVPYDGPYSVYVQDDEPAPVIAGDLWWDGDEWLCWDGATWVPQDMGAGTFLALTDTPASYVGQAGQAVRVNTAEDGVEFVTPSGLPGAPADGEIYALRDNQWVPSPISPVGATATHYLWDSATANASPAPGYIRANNADHALATALYINATSRFGNSTLAAWTSLQQEDYIGIWEEGTDRAGITYQVTGAPINGTTWVTVFVAAVPGSGGGMNNLQPVTVHTADNPRNKLPLGGFAGQVLTKVDSASFNADWQTPAKAEPTTDQFMLMGA